MKTVLIRRGKFPLGLVALTAGIHTRLDPDQVARAISRHAAGDWGELDAEDQQENERSLQEGGRLMSRYRATDGTVFYVVTEHDRSYTTVLLPEEY
jgi:hypothetical protein